MILDNMFESTGPADNRRHFVAIFSLLIFTLVFFREGLFLNTRTVNWDTAHIYYPNMYFMGNMLRNFDLPLWNPYLFTGYPAFVNIESQNFYPINYLFLLFTDFTAKTVYIQLVLHYFLAASFMYNLCFYYIRNSAAALVGAVTFAFSGFMIGHFQHLIIIEGVIWLPLIVYFLERSIGEKRIDMACYGSLAFTMSILAGHPQTFFYIGCYIVLHGVYRAFKNFYSEHKGSIPLTNAAMMVFIICFFAILLSFVQLLPTYEFASLTGRKGPIPPETVFAGGVIGIEGLISFLVPSYFFTGISNAGSYYWGFISISQGIFYCSVAGLLLFIVGIIKYKINGDIIFFAVFSLFIVLLVTGEEKSLYYMFYEYVPGFDKFRGPINMRFLFHFAFSIIAAYGAYALYEGMMKNKDFLLSIGVLMSLFITLFLLAPPAPQEFYSIREENINGAVKSFFVFLILSIIAINAVIKFKNTAIFVVPLIIAIDLLVNLSGSACLGMLRSHDFYDKQPVTVEAINKLNDFEDKKIDGVYLEGKEQVLSNIFRIHTEPRGSNGQVGVEFNQPGMFKTFLTQGYDPLILDRVKKMGTLFDARPIDYMNITSSQAVIVTEPENKISIKTYDKPNNILYFADKVRFFDDDEALLEEMKYGSFDSKHEVFIEGAPFQGADNSLSKKDVEIINYHPNSVSVNTESESDGILIFSDTYYKGWKVFVDGTEQKLLRANYNFKAVHVPGGRHVVKFVFVPLVFWYGLIVSFTGIILIIMLVRFAGRKSFYDFYNRV